MLRVLTPIPYRLLLIVDDDDHDHYDHDNDHNDQDDTKLFLQKQHISEHIAMKWSMLYLSPDWLISSFLFKIKKQFSVATLVILSI